VNRSVPDAAIEPYNICNRRGRRRIGVAWDALMNNPNFVNQVLNTRL
jgi:hypothetical protein